MATSVGWIGAVAAFAAVAGLGAAGRMDVASAGLYVALQAMMWIVIVPLAVLALVTGILQAIGTQWGLFRHYWVLIKLVLTVGATALLLLHTRVANSAAEFAVSADPRLDPLRFQLFFDAVAGLLVLLLVAILGWVKPRGRLRA